MARIKLREFAVLLIGVTMAAIGFLGLNGTLTLEAVVTGVIFVAVSLASFELGRAYHQPGRDC